ncbi:hypothetical protein [Modestobacter sp. Leaf380]|uniref:hypothetical protein n=1 Tax=Modestobacter sp. Leaf380 TaxID=1736356 RepID=UPI0012FB1136|nr:hypothetical protein [Modestobacter sp. Leaf380]
MSRPGQLPPLMETRKVLAAARPPAGEGPPTREVLRGLRELRPPVSVLVGVALMALMPLGLLVLSLWLLAATWTGPDGVFLSLVKTVLFSGTLFLLSALSWRGVKRALHSGDYQQGFFVARLATVVCGVIGAFLLWYVYGDGNPQEPSMLAPFVVLAVAWLPVLPLQARAAREWPSRVLLRGGPAVRGVRELAMLLEARTHTCGRPLPVQGMTPVADSGAQGWAWNGPCPACGVGVVQVFSLRAADAADPADPWAWGRPGSAPALGGGDLLYLADRFDVLAGGDPATWSVEQLENARTLLIGSVQATGELLALVPQGKAAVPLMKRFGRPVQLVGDPEQFTRVRLEQRLGERRSRLQAVQAELVRRGQAPAALPC